MVVPAGAQVTLYFSLNGVLAMNRLGGLVTGSPTFDQTLANTLGSAIKATWSADMAGQCTSGTSLVRVGVRDLRADNLHEFRDTNAPVSGTATGDAMPGNVAMCITLRTATAGKSGRGRVYLGGWAESANGPNGTASATAQTQGVLFVQHVDVNMQAAGMSLAVLTLPQLDTVITQTVTNANGTTTVRTLSHQTAKPGQARDVIIVESRGVGWESQRRRINGRGAAPTSLLDGVSVELNPH